MVRVELVDDEKWLVRITSDTTEDEHILVGPRGEVVIRNMLYGEDFTAWEGFAEEPEYPEPEEGSDE